MKRSHLQIAFSLLAVFISGAVVGGFGYHLYTVKAVTLANSQNPPRLTPEEWRKKYVSEMRTRLQLSDDQASQLNATLDKTRGLYDEAKQRHKVELDGIHDEQVHNIRAMLSPVQATEYDKARAEREARRKLQQQQQK